MKFQLKKKYKQIDLVKLHRMHINYIQLKIQFAYERN